MEGQEEAMETPHELRAKADRYQRLALTLTDSRAVRAALELVSEYREAAAELEADRGVRDR
jgi:hypothetical protein